MSPHCNSFRRHGWQWRSIRTTLRGRGCEVRQSHIPRGLTISKGAVPGRDPGFGHMAPTYLCRFPGSRSDGLCGSALSSSVGEWNSAPLMTTTIPIDQLKTESAQDRVRAARCAARRPSGRPRPRRSRRGRSRCRSQPGIDRVGLLAAEDRDQSAAADAQARRRRRQARAAGGGRPRQAADHARLCVRPAAERRRLGHPRAEGRTRRKSIPTS